MRYTFLLAILVFISVPLINAQTNKEIIGDARSSQKTIKGAPFSAEAVTESVQILADGTRITRASGSKIYRDSEGRYRRDESRKNIGVPGDNIEIAESIMILDPVSGSRYEINVKDRSYRQNNFRSNFESVKMETQTIEWKLKDEKKFEIKMKLDGATNEEKAARMKELEKQAEKLEDQAEKLKEQNKESEKKNKETVAEIKSLEMQAKELEKKAKEIENNSRTRSATESLGQRDIEGVAATGTRTTTTIPMGTIGNDRDIVVTYEKWYSADLQMTIFSKHSDPRFGENIFRLFNISRNDPPISTFLPPPGYTDAKDKNRADKPRTEREAADKNRAEKPRKPDTPKVPKIGKKPNAPSDMPAKAKTVQPQL